MLTLPLTAVVVTVLQFHRHSCANTPAVTKNLPLLDRLPQGDLGQGNEQLLPFPEDDDDLTTHLIENAQLLADDTHLLDTTGSHLFGTAHRVVRDAHLRERTHDLGSLLRQHNNLQPLDTLQPLLPSNLVHQRGSSSSSSRILGGLGEEEAEEEEMDDETRLVLLYSLLPRSSDKRGRRGGWKPRGRHGKGGKGGWGDLGGKRQAVLDRMPLSYGRKREAWAAGSSSEGVFPEGEAAAAFQGVRVYRGKRDGGDSRFKPV